MKLIKDRAGLARSIERLSLLITQSNKRYCKKFRELRFNAIDEKRRELLQDAAVNRWEQLSAINGHK